MPRVDGTYAAPYPDVIPDTTIESEVHNGTVADLVLDANAVRPVTAGGTGATSPAAARDNLDAMVAGVQVTNYNSHVWENGSFWSAAGATGAPNPGSAFTGLAALVNNNQDTVSLNATDQVTGLNYSRVKNTTWEAWVATDLGGKVDVIGDTMTGDLVIAKASPLLELQSTAGTDGRIKAKQAGLTKWEMVLGLGLGGDFMLNSYDDAGVIVAGAPPLRINRDSGRITVNSNPTLALEVAPKQYADTKVAKAGDTMTGPLTIADDMILYRSGAPTTGNLFFGAGSSQSLLYNGTSFTFGNAPIIANGVKSTSDITTYRVATPTTGNIFFDQALTKSIFFDGTDFLLNAGVRASGGSLLSAASIANSGLAVTSNPGYGNTLVGFVAAAGSAAFHSSAAASCATFNINADGANVAYLRSGTQVGSVDVTTTTTSFVTSSDDRLKEDLKSFDAGNVVDNTNVYDFAWKTTGERSYGVIAQQANEVYPAAVFHDEKNDWWGIDYSKYVPVLLQEMKALRERVAELEGRLDAKPS